MNKLPLTLAVVIALGLAGVLVAQSQSKASLQRAVASLQREVQMLKTQSEKDHRLIAELIAKNDVYKNESESLRQNLAAGGGAAGNSAPPTGGAVKEGEKSEGGPGSFMKGVAKMFTDPEMKKAMRGQQSMIVRTMYADLAKELGLAPEEANQLIELLTERQMGMAARSMELMGDGGADAKKLEESGKSINASRKEYDAQINALLGEERAKKFAEYERTIGDRMQMQQVQQAFTASGVPLQDSQRDGLMAIMKEERLKTPASPFDASNKDVSAQMKALQNSDAVDKAMQQTQDFNTRVLTRARTVLTPEQINAFEAAQKQQLEMMQLGMKMSREMFKGK
jgi:hypothetical protein